MGFQVTGKEYITEKKLRQEVKEQVEKLGGRIGLADLPPLLEVDIVHCEKAAKILAKEGEEKGDIRLIDGEVSVLPFFFLFPFVSFLIIFLKFLLAFTNFF